MARISFEEFVKVWETSSTLQEVADTLNMTRSQASVRAGRHRRDRRHVELRRADRPAQERAVPRDRAAARADGRARVRGLRRGRARRVQQRDRLTTLDALNLVNKTERYVCQCKRKFDAHLSRGLPVAFIWATMSACVAKKFLMKQRNKRLLELHQQRRHKKLLWYFCLHLFF